jgi:hypothetical protein
MQPRPLIGAQVGGIALPDRLPSPRLRQEPAEQHDVPRIRKDAVRSPYPPPVQFPEEPVELQVIRTVRTQQERQAVSDPRKVQRRNATGSGRNLPRPGRVRSIRDMQVDDRVIAPAVRLASANASTLVIHLSSPRRDSM